MANLITNLYSVINVLPQIAPSLPGGKIPSNRLQNLHQHPDDAPTILVLPDVGGRPQAVLRQAGQVRERVRRQARGLVRRKARELVRGRRGQTQLMPTPPREATPRQYTKVLELGLWKTDVTYQPIDEDRQI